MTLVQQGAESLIAQFGVNIEVYPQDSQSPEDSNDPVFFDDTENDSDYNQHKVRLYSTASKDMMEDYGLEENSDALFYATEDVASQGDKVKYPNDGRVWYVTERVTNQLDSDGPYLFIYSMEAV